VSLLRDVAIENLAVGVVAVDDGGMLEQVPAAAIVLPADLAIELAELYEFEAMPFAIHQRDGHVVGTIHSEALASLTEIERFWTFSGARLKEVAV